MSAGIMSDLKEGKMKYGDHVRFVGGKGKRGRVRELVGDTHILVAFYGVRTDMWKAIKSPTLVKIELLEVFDPNEKKPLGRRPYGFEGDTINVVLPTALRDKLDPSGSIREQTYYLLLSLGSLSKKAIALIVEAKGGRKG